MGRERTPEELEEIREYMSRLDETEKALRSSLRSSPHPPLGTLIKIGKLKGGFLRFYVPGGLKYDTMPGAPIAELWTTISKFYEEHTKLRKT